MKRIILIGLALALLVCGTPESQSREAVPETARQMAGRWRLFLPGPRPTPKGLLALRFRAGALSGTYTPPAGRTVPLRRMFLSTDRLAFRFTLPGKGRGRTFRGRFAPTLDADAWTGQLSGPTGAVPMDMVR